ncbi:hypothetical protein Tco_1422334 [Tanacetum coccineum]
MLKELRSVIVGGALIHKNHESINNWSQEKGRFPIVIDGDLFQLNDYAKFVGTVPVTIGPNLSSIRTLYVDEMGWMCDIIGKTLATGRLWEI